MKRPILIADGDAELCSVYGHFLTDHGYTVHASSDGLACLSKLRQLMPAALILDLGLPWGGGAGVLDWLREERSMHDIPVILTATAGHSGDVAGFRDLPVADFLQKPFALTALLAAVRSAVAKVLPAQTKLLHAHSELLIG